MKQLLKNEATIAIVIMSSFVVIVSLSSIYTYSMIYNGNACTCTIPIYFLTSVLPSAGVIIGAVVSYLLGLKLKESKSKGKNITNSLFKLFSKDERKIMKELIKHNDLTQASIGRNTNLDRVKVHRIILNLERRGIIVKEPNGKTNNIKLSQEFIFLKNK